MCLFNSTKNRVHPQAIRSKEARLTSIAKRPTEKKEQEEERTMVRSSTSDDSASIDLDLFLVRTLPILF